MTDDIPSRVSRVEAKMDSLAQAQQQLTARQNQLESMHQEMRDDLLQMRADLHDDIGDLKTTVHRMGTDMLNSLPQWAVRSMGMNHKVIGALLSALGIAVSTILYLIFRHAA